MTSTQIVSLILLPILLAGAHGYFTNWMAVNLLLKPVHPVNILGFRLQGLLPRRQAALAERISEAIAERFLTEKDILQFLSLARPDEAIRRVFLEKWEEHVEEILADHPFIRMFLRTEKLHAIRDRIAAILERESGGLIEGIVKDIEHRIDLRATLKRNILAFEVSQLTGIIEQIGFREFREIAWVGAVIGLGIGLIHAIINLLVFL